MVRKLTPEEIDKLVDELNIDPQTAETLTILLAAWYKKQLGIMKRVINLLSMFQYVSDIVNPKPVSKSGGSLEERIAELLVNKINIDKALPEINIPEVEVDENKLKSFFEKLKEEGSSGSEQGKQ